MARPIKNNCDYFPHDRDMRNHKKIKAVRNKFTNGYAIWSMILEHLTGSDGNVFPHTDLEFELMAGDFGFSVTEIRDVVNYCISLELLFLRDGFVNSDSLDERLAPVFEKRNKAKELSKQQLRDNGKFDSRNTVHSVVSVTEIPQSKVKESKVKESKVKESKVKESKVDVIEVIFKSQDFKEIWDKWKNYKKTEHKFAYRSKLSEQAAMNELLNLSSGNELLAIEIINQSIAKGWKGFFKINNKSNDNKHFKGTNGTSGSIDTRSIDYSKQF